MVHNVKVKHTFVRKIIRFIIIVTHADHTLNIILIDLNNNSSLQPRKKGFFFWGNKKARKSENY